MKVDRALEGFHAISAFHMVKFIVSGYEPPGKNDRVESLDLFAARD